nr:hypothetical protein Q903MT_gene1992 [Picea sitchensis]
MSRIRNMQYRASPLPLLNKEKLSRALLPQESASHFLRFDETSPIDSPTSPT